MRTRITNELCKLVAAYDPATPSGSADSPRDLWLQCEPKSEAATKAE